jgi:hypothetical protein
MRILKVHDDHSRFFQELAGAKRRVLVVDYDSVIARHPASGNSGVPYPSISELLDCIMTTSHTRVVLITDGKAAELAPAVPGPVPDICGTGGPADQEVMLPDMLAKLGEDTAVAFIGDRAHSFAMIPEVADDGGAPVREGAAGESQEFVQFLVDWLRVCGGEIC